MNAELTSPERESAVSQEERGRADFYALISRLFFAAPDAELLAALGAADEIDTEAEDVALARAWHGLIAAAAAMDAEAAREEYDSVFVGTGKAEITPYASHYLSESMKENVLVRLRAELAAAGLARQERAAEYEDHVAGLCEVMRHLILDAHDAAVQKQKIFFLEYVAPWYAAFCIAAVASPNTNFYKHVAQFTKTFLDVELKSFEMAE